MKTALIALAMLAGSAVYASADPLTDMLFPPVIDCSSIQVELKEQTLAPNDISKNVAAGLIALEQVLLEKKQITCDLTSLKVLTWAYGEEMGTQLHAVLETVTAKDVEIWKRGPQG